MKIEIYHNMIGSCECCRWVEATIEIIINQSVIDTYHAGWPVYDIDDLREILKNSPYTDFTDDDVTGYY